MLTRSGWLVLVGSALTIAAGRLFGLGELYLLGATGISLTLVALLLVRRRPPVVDVERIIVPLRVHLGGTSRVELRIINRGHRPAPLLTLHDPVAGTIGATVSLAPLAPGGREAASYRLPTDRRGLVAVGPLEAQLTDAFGLARRRFPVAGPAALTVLPAIEILSGLATGGRLEDPLVGVAHPVLGVAGDGDFATLRPYVVGDDLRRVHWSSSARAGDLLVRQDDPPWQGHLTVLLDARSDHVDEDRFELAVSAAASLVHAVAERGDRARLVLTNGTDTGLLDARAARFRLLEHLAVVQRHRPSKLPAFSRDGRSRTGGLVLVTGTPAPDDLAHLATQRSRFASVRLVVVDPSAVEGREREPAPSPGPGIDVVVIERNISFAAAWSAALRRPAVRR